MINLIHQALRKSCKSHYGIILLVMLAYGEVYSAVPSSVYQQSVQNKKFEYRIIGNPDNTFGYDIFNGEKMIIHQTSIPGIAGTHGFINKKDAAKTAKLVVRKLRKGLFPPTIFDEELKRLKVKTI